MITRPGRSNGGWFAKWSMDALEWMGERCLWLGLWNPQNAGTTPHCSYCWNATYGESDTSLGVCVHCLGTGYQGGIRQAVWLPCLFNKLEPQVDMQQKRGTLETVKTTVSLPSCVSPMRNDIVVRCNGWRITSTGVQPLEVQCWRLTSIPQPMMVKDGFQRLSMERIMGWTSDTVVDETCPASSLMFTGLSVSPQHAGGYPVLEPATSTSIVFPYERGQEIIGGLNS